MAYFKTIKSSRKHYFDTVASYSPELNPMEQVWQWMKHNHLSNICFESYDDIVDKLSIAWNAFSDNDTLVKSICSRQWMNV